MAQSCFRPIQLYHNYSAYDHTICRAGPTLTVSTSPEQDPILALVEAMWAIFALEGTTQADLFDEVQVLFPNIYTTTQLLTALRKALSTGVFIKLVPPVRYLCCETEPCVPRFTFSPNLDRCCMNPNPYVAYLFGEITSTAAIKQMTFAQIFKTYTLMNPGTGFAVCCT